MMWKKLSSVVINYIFVYCQKSMELPRSNKSFLFFAEIMKSRPWDSLLCYGWLNGKGVVMLLQKSSIASRIIWIFDSSHTIHTTVCLLDMFNEHASSSFHSYSCLFRQGYHKELQAPYVIITIFIIYLWTTTKSQIIMQMSYNHFMFMQILC